MSTTLADNFETSFDGRWRLVNNTWGIEDQINGIDYTQTITLDPDDISSNVLFQWDFGRNPAGNILAYPSINLGYKPWDEDGSRFMVTRVGDLRELDVAAQGRISGQTSNCNVAYDLWLTDKPAGDFDDITTEVMIWLHQGGFTPAGEIVGTFKVDGEKAFIWIDTPAPGELSTGNMLRSRLKTPL